MTSWEKRRASATKIHTFCLLENPLDLERLQAGSGCGTDRPM